MIYIDESETFGGLLACANKYAVADDDNKEEGESRRRESGMKKVDECRNSGTWGSPSAAKVGPPSVGPPRR